MVWTTVPSSDMDPESPLTTSLINALYDNVAAAMNQDAGAPAPGTNFISLASQIANGIIGSAEIAANAVGSSELNTTIASSGTHALGVGASWVPGAGLYNFYWANSQTHAELYVSGSWRALGVGAVESSCALVCDGTNMRIRNISGGDTVYYQKF